MNSELGLYGSRSRLGGRWTKAVCWTVVLLVCFLPPTFADNISVSVSGNTRTQSSYIKNIVHDYIQQAGIQEAADIDIARLEALILDKELFSEARVAVRDNTIHVTVKDRWTLIPIPVLISQSGEDTKYGLFVLESNLLGYGKTVVAGAMLSKSQGTYFFMYQDPEVASTDWTFDTQIVKVDKVTYQYQGEEKLFGDDRSLNKASVSLGYMFLEGVKAGLGMGWTDISYNALNDYATPDDTSAVSGRSFFELDAATFRFYYKEGWQGRLEFDQQLYRHDSAPKASQIEAVLLGEKNVVGQQAIQAQLNVGYLNNGDERDLIRVGGNRGFRGIQDEGVWVDRYATLALDYQIPIWFGNLGTWTVAPFCDIGQLRQPQGEDTVVTYTAIGLGTYLYLKEVALPGVGIYAGYNDSFQETFFSATIGFAF